MCHMPEITHCAVKFSWIELRITSLRRSGAHSTYANTEEMQRQRKSGTHAEASEKIAIAFVFVSFRFFFAFDVNSKTTIGSHTESESETQLNRLHVPVLYSTFEFSAQGRRRHLMKSTPHAHWLLIRIIFYTEFVFLCYFQGEREKKNWKDKQIAS